MKKDILVSAGYRYNFDRDLFVNRDVKKAFSLEFVNDHPEDELVQRIRENKDENGWQFYFNSEPSDGVRRELERVLG